MNEQYSEPDHFADVKLTLHQQSTYLFLEMILFISLIVELSL